MKNIIAALFMSLAMPAYSANVIWRHSFSGDAVVHSNDGTFSIAEYAENVLGDSLYNVAYMIKDTANNSYLNFRFDDYGPDSINWVEGTGGYEYILLQDAILGNVDTPKSFPDWSTFDGNWGDYIVELSLYDEDSDTFTQFAVSDIFALTQSSRGVGAYGTVEPPAAEAWLKDFYANDYVPPVPEPSVTTLLLLGIAALCRRRTWRRIQ